MSLHAGTTRTGNRLLDRLPKQEYDRLRRAGEVVTLPPRQEVYRPDGPLSYVYFPSGGIISVLVQMEDGKAAEAATVGNEGLLGISLALGLDSSPCLATAQVPGDCLRVPASVFTQTMVPGGPLDRLVRRYAAYSLYYARQSIACNLLHPARKRMCRWLLMSRDRVGRDEFPLTHEFLAEMLGVRRQTVTVLAGTLHRAGLIRTRRGAVRILDRQGLEAASCECYGVTKALYERMVR